ncbi:two-component system, sensor histidine kinase RegB [Faunimonas pinastri]|uniref:histidine kinase n=1 Tax=Faunimonas pinastri TaxID=1855383 RepID=A0A1H9GPW7_9HYPH|nr:ActS/PrrB/RegB family redox-sensitive histidine kinase [Faunimonas pinastri]SEQ52145.1 two-component system, sensor histidine kinase RegB [Faunimonas pinastri]
MRQLTIERQFSGRSLRLSTLMRIRWLAIGGQTAAVLVVGLWFDFPLPFGACFTLIAISAWLNIALRIRFPSSVRLIPTWSSAILAFDILELSGLLYLTGGLENPFAVLLLAPVVLSAGTLQPDKTFLLGALVLAAATALVFEHMPLPWFAGSRFVAPLHYLGGVWIALMCALGFIGFYGFRVAQEARELAEALAATELILQREQHLSALDGLAAAAAHELGTPLATIALVANELESEITDDDPRADDIRLLKAQSRRCREILSKLTSLSSAPEEHLGRMSFSQILEEVSDPHHDFGIDIRVEQNGVGAEPVAVRNPGLMYGLGNLVENAVDFAREAVELEAFWDSRTVSVKICDDGPGFSPEVMDRIGEPYVTTRRTDANALPTGEHGGMGLGFFIAKTLLERSGAELTFTNRKAPRTGAVVSVTWPRGAFKEPETAPYRTKPIAVT